MALLSGSNAVGCRSTAPVDVFVHARSRVGMRVCMCLSPLLVWVCMYMYVNAVERLRLHKAVILLLIMKYFVLKIVSYSHKTTPCNLINK